jgi:DNA-binding MarR family transcriptional regulator
MELAPLVLRTMRQEMARETQLDLSMPEFRSLRFITRHPGTTLSALAEHLAVSLPAASKLIDRLLTMELVTRAIDPDDRRRAVLELTEGGLALVAHAHGVAQAHFAAMLATVELDDLDAFARMLSTLRTGFLDEVGKHR